jgi:5-methylcytosine-specific restriction enzyme A
MPCRPKQPCRHPSCPELVEAGFCDTHKAVQPQRGTSSERGYDYRWQKVRLLVLRRDKYLCQHCLRQGVITVATDVDHIIALSRGGARLDPANLQSLCRTCHNRKTASDQTIQSASSANSCGDRRRPFFQAVFDSSAD